MHNIKKIISFLVVVIFPSIIISLSFIGCQDTKANVRFGSVLILSGDFKSYGEQFRDGATLAVNNINQDEKKLDVLFYDSQGNKELAIQKLKTLKEVDKVDFVTEIMGTGIALNAIPYITKNKMLVLSGVNTGPDFTIDGGPYFYRTIPSDGVAAQQLAKWALELKYDEGVIVYSTDVWGSGLKKILEKTYTDLGGKLNSVEATEMNQTIFQPVISKLKQTKPKVVFLLMYPKDAGLFLKEARKQKFDSNFMGTDNFTGTELAEIAGKAVERVMFVLPNTDQSKSEQSQEFIQLYKKSYGDEKEPSLFTLMGFDCVNMMYQVFNRANGDTDKAREILSSIEYQGVSGQVSFDRNNDVVVKEFSRKIFEFNKSTNQSDIKDFTE